MSLPKEPAQRALVLDVARVVDAREQIGWLLDELDVQAVLPDAMASVCRVDDATRHAALRWLDEEIVLQGGPVEEAFVTRGHDLDAVADLLVLSRTRAVLATADMWADAGKCPFWLKPEPSFAGLQGFAKKLVLSVETGARFYAQREGDEFGFGGGGTGRLLIGYGFAHEWTMLAGIEFGGAARFTNVRVGSRAEVPAVLLFIGAPLISRYHVLSDHFEVELGPVGYFNQLRGKLQAGARIGVGYGFSRIVLRGVLPGITLSANYDFVPAQAGLPVVHQVGAGLRGTFSTMY